MGWASGSWASTVVTTVSFAFLSLTYNICRLDTSLLVIGYGRLKAFGVAFLTGLVEPVGGLFGSAMVSLAEPLMPWTLGFAAGAMVFIISDEIVPETHRGNYSLLATFSLMVGVAVMVLLDVLLS